MGHARVTRMADDQGGRFIGVAGVVSEDMGKVMAWFMLVCGYEGKVEGIRVFDHCARATVGFVSSWGYIYTSVTLFGVPGRIAVEVFEQHIAFECVLLQSNVEALDER